MTQEGFKRKLTVVLSADAVGYSRLMAEDEAATVKTISSYREIITSLIKQHRGRVVDSPGDNILAEFSSVVDAVQGAVAVQNEIQTRNAGLAENRRMKFRIGINLGDVIDEDYRLYGDGVNIAARLESLADPGGICVSKTAFDQIETKLPLGYEYLGEQPVKNIPKPVGAYRILMQPDDAGKVIGEKRFLGRFSRRTAMAAIVMLVVVAAVLAGWNIYLQQSKKVEPASVEKMAFPLPDKPSIAVLPFVNMSGDSEQEYFSDGLTEEIITAFSKVPEMFVIARNSTFVYKDKPVKVQKVAEDLGVRYVLEGSVRKGEEKVRITAQLIDALTGHHLWAERYDRNLKDIFAVQDEITMRILSALEVKLTDGEQALIQKKGTNNLKAYLKLLQGIHYSHVVNPENVLKARQIFEGIISEEPNYAIAYSQIARTYWIEVLLGTSKSPKESLRKAADLAKKSLSIDQSLGASYAYLGHINIMRRNWEKGISLLNQAVELEPNGAESHYLLGLGLSFSGRPGEAIPIIKKAIRLNPITPAPYYNVIAIAYRMEGQLDKAIDWLEKGIQRYPNILFSHLNLSACYILAGREQEAHKEAKEVLRLNPKFSLNRFEKALPLKDQEEKKRFIGALRKAFSFQSDS